MAPPTREPDIGAVSKGGESNTVILRAFLANVGIAFAKFIAAAMSGSSAMLTEGVHSLVDSINQVLLWWGKKRAGRKPDTLHPLGYGRELYFWSVVVAMTIFGAGAGVSGYEGYAQISAPEPTTRPLIAYGVLAVAICLEGWSLRTAYREFDQGRHDGESLWEGIRTTKDTTTLVVLLEDSAAVVGILIAAAGIGLELLTGNAIWDGVASICIGALLATVAFLLMREAKNLLIGESADPKLVAAIRARVENVEEVDRVEDVTTIHLAPERVTAVISADFRDDMAVGRLERLVAQLERELRSRYPVLERIYIRPVGVEPERGEDGAIAAGGSG